MLSSEIKPVQEALEAWDSGAPVWSVEMGGLGPGYEQAIQITAFEMLKYMHENPFDYEEANEEKWEVYRDQIDLGIKDKINVLGLSGAQHGAALNIAACFIRQGYRKALDSAGKDRGILVSKNFPISKQPTSTS